jgi:hypothetical protein
VTAAGIPKRGRAESRHTPSKFVLDVDSSDHPVAPRESHYYDPFTNSASQPIKRVCFDGAFSVFRAPDWFARVCVGTHTVSPSLSHLSSQRRAEARARARAGT